jgi:hypothetical protein
MTPTTCPETCLVSTPRTKAELVLTHRLDESFANAPNAVDNARPYTPQNPTDTGVVSVYAVLS